MDPIKLLSNQIQQYQQQNQEQFHKYQEQNEHDHRMLESKIDQILGMMQAMIIEQNSHKKRLDGLESGQTEIKQTIDDIDKRVKNLEQRAVKSDHLRDWILKGLGVAALIAGLFATVWKFNLF